MTESATRGLLAQIFISPDEPRLRAGWRLLIHTILLIISILVILGGITVLLIVLATAHLIPANLAELQRGTISSKSLPGWVGPLFFLAEAAAFTLPTWIARRFLDRRSFLSLGLHFDRHTWLDLGVGIAIAAL